MSSRAKCALLGLILLGALCGMAAADDLDRARVEGRVVDGNGQGIPNARVTVREAATAAEREGRSDGEGRYRFAALPPGRYALTATAEGFQTLRVEQLWAAAGATLRVELRLAPARIEARVTIDGDADRPLVDPTRTTVGGSLARDEAERLPVESRDPLALVFTLPGTSPAAYSERDLAEGDARAGYRRSPEEAGLFSLNGGTPFSNNLTIEGLDNNDDRAARERFTPSLAAVDEIQVVANQFSAEYGRASGGRLNLRLRGGASRFHGQGFFFFRDESLNANGFLRNADPSRARRMPYQNRNPGLSLGGPLLPGRIFWFAAWERDFTYDRAEIAALLPFERNPAIPLPAPNGANLGAQARDKTGKPLTVNDGFAVGLYDQRLSTPRTADTLQSRIDLRPGGRHEGFVLVTLARTRDERGFPGGRRTPDTLRRTGRDSQSVAFADNAVFGAQAFNSLRLQLSRLRPADAPARLTPVILLDLDDPRDVAGDASANPFTRSGRLTAGASTLGGTDRREERGQLQDTLHLPRGAHALRVGFDLQAIRSRFTDLTDSTGTISFASLGDFLRNRPSRYVHRFFTDSERRNRYLGIFVQDDWRPRPNLTLAAGLRWDDETILRDRNNFGPRVALAWGPGASAKTAVRAGAGMFYNRALLRTLDDFSLTAKTIRVDTDDPAASVLLATLSFPQVLRPEDPRVRQLGVREADFIRRLGRGFRIPESYQASAGVERQLGRGLRGSVDYVFNRGLHLWREVNANAPRLPDGAPDFSAYLTGRDFDNRRDPLTGQRPITATGNADIVRFIRSGPPTQTLREGRGSVVVFSLDNPSTSNLTSGLKAALAALRPLRPDPTLTQVEELQARGNSRYHGLNLELESRLSRRGHVRAAYTLSRWLDDGVVNTSSPLVVGDFRREWSRSLLDARHRLALSGFYELPRRLGGWELAGVFHLASSRPFSLGIGGNDRNLDDVGTDRPLYQGDPDRIVWRRPGDPLPPGLLQAFSLPLIGSIGNLPRNAGRGPRTHTLNLRVSRGLRLSEQVRLSLQLEAFNPLNATVFSFGAEYIDYNPASPGDFLVPTRNVKPRTLRTGLKLEF